MAAFELAAESDIRPQYPAVGCRHFRLGSPARLLRDPFPQLRMSSPAGASRPIVSDAEMRITFDELQRRTLHRHTRPSDTFKRVLVETGHPSMSGRLQNAGVSLASRMVKICDLAVT